MAGPTDGNLLGLAGVYGYVAMFASVLIVEWFYFDILGYAGSTSPELLLPFAGAVAGLVACLEAITPGEVDNLVLPLALAGYLHLLGV